MECLFCKISKKEIPSAFIYEDENALSILDIHPRSPGHTIILPKIHAESLLSLPDETIGKVFYSVKKTTELLLKKLNPKGFTIGINHGEIAGQVVPHLHIHIIPRYEKDGGGSIHSVVNYETKESIEEIKKKIIS